MINDLNRYKLYAIKYMYYELTWQALEKLPQSGFSEEQTQVGMAKNKAIGC